MKMMTIETHARPVLFIYIYKFFFCLFKTQLDIKCLPCVYCWSHITNYYPGASWKFGSMIQQITIIVLYAMQVNGAVCKPTRLLGRLLGRLGCTAENNEVKHFKGSNHCRYYCKWEIENWKFYCSWCGKMSNSRLVCPKWWKRTMLPFLDDNYRTNVWFISRWREHISEAIK